MHEIAFAIPHLFSGESSSPEKDRIRECLSTCLKKLQSTDSKTRIESDGGNGQISFLLPRVFSRNSDLLDNARAAEALLECLTQIDSLFLDFHGPLDLQGGPVLSLYHHPLYYKRTVVWDTTPALFERGYGDCKSLSATRVAEYRALGRHAYPFFRYMPPSLTDNHEFMYHIVVGKDVAEPPVSVPILWEDTTTSWEDPSKRKGMGQNEWAYFDTDKKKSKSTLQAAGDFVAGLFR